MLRSRWGTHGSICKWASLLATTSYSNSAFVTALARSESSAAALDYSSTSALLECLVNFEQTGVPHNAGTDGAQAFDLVSANYVEPVEGGHI